MPLPIVRRVLTGEQRERLLKERYDVKGVVPDDLSAYVAAETVKWAKVIKAAKIKVR
jgi:tripartite-type tricarboxylate transporter receptor subunit TctC